ncbi:MAG: prolyl oligopeptidase family serine peptidase [Dehalococcoidia bacterium]
MPHYAFEQFAAVRNYTNLSFSPDARWLTYVTNASGQFNVWKQPVNLAPDGHPLAPVQLTALVEEAARRAVWSPDGSRILTAADFHGTENFQLFEIPADRGWLYPITSNPDARYEAADEPFSPDGRRILYGSNERERKDFDVVMRDLASGEMRTLLAGDANYFPAGWSPDGRFALAAKSTANTDQDLYLSDVQSGESHHLTPHEGEVRFFPGPWSPDSRGFYLLTDRDREFLGLAFFDITDNGVTWVETPDWDVSGVALSKDGRLLVWIVNEDGYSRLYARDRHSGQRPDFPALPRGVIQSLDLSADGRSIALLLATPVSPADVYVLDVESGQSRRLTQAFLGGIPKEEMVEPEVIRYPTHDGRQIPAWLYRPKQTVGVPGRSPDRRGLGKGCQPPVRAHDGAGRGRAGSPTQETRVPVVLSIHGGPEAQELPGYAYNGLYQYLLNRGIGVLAPNIRGSTGYGKSYQKLIHRDFGGAELKDLEHAVRYLHGLDWVDPQRLGVFGGSFGGFATLSCVTRLPQYWAAAVDIVGPSNLITFARAVPPWWKRLMRDWVGDPDEDAELLRERSPITYVDNARAPLLVIQGANDPRVVKAESDQMVERLRQLEVPVEYMVFEDEGHGFTKTANALAGFRATAEWFERYLTPTR